MPQGTALSALARAGAISTAHRRTSDSPRTARRHLTAVAVMLLALCLASAGTLAQSGSSDAGSKPVPTPAQLDERIKKLESSDSVDESLKLSLGELYARIRTNLDDTASFKAKTDELGKLLANAPAETKSIQRDLAKRQSARAKPGTSKVPSGLTAEDVSQRLTKTLADVAAQETRVHELEKLLDDNLDRPGANRARLVEVRRLLDEVDDGIGRNPAPGEPPELSQAKRWALETQREALWAEAKMLEQDLLSQSVREELYKAQRDQASWELGALQEQQRALEQRLSELRKQQAEAAQEASEKAQRDSTDKAPVVRDIILQNAEVSDSLSRIAKRLEGFSGELSSIEGERKRVEDDFRGARQRLEAVGLSKALGQVLLDRRNQLPDLPQLRKDIADREDAIADATLRQIRYREEEQTLRDIPRHADEVIDSSREPQEEGVRDQLIEALQQRKDLLDQALRIEDDYIRQLAELNYAAERVIQVSESYDDFLAERLLWVRSAPAVNLETLTALPGAIGWLLSIDGWSNLGQTLLERAKTSPIFWAGVAAVLLLSWKLSALRRAIRANAEPLRRVRTDRVRFTLQAIGITLLTALPIPLLTWLLGEQLQASIEANTFTRAVGVALAQVAWGLYYLLSFRMLCINGGVADRHFRWSTVVLNRVRRNFDWFLLYAVPVSIVTIAIYQHNDAAYINSLGRLMLIANLCGFAAFFWLLLHPSTGVLSELLQDHPTGWLNRSRKVWLPIVVGAPVALVVLAVIGYAYTAGVLFQSLVYQVWLALALVVIHQTIVRWLIVTRRRLALQAALDRQAARRAQAEVERTDPSTPSEVLAVEEHEPDLATLDEQTRRLINASIFIGGIIGLWLTWSDVLPAFTFFERFALWHYTGAVDGAEQMIPVTAADVALVLVISFVGAIAAKNLPALLEILLLQSGTVSAGARYAITTLSSYFITAIAALLVFGTLGLSWGQVQWLVAALGVGIGFGLQEIVANFISGIIILFERPVRVGDIVTIGDTTGVVSNISIRATTIRNWDKQELLVPNKEFITGRLLNWTLTDQQNRITIPVGIEYGSDTKQALALLSQVAEHHERVLEDPAPLISFEGFADNSLTLILRCYLDSLDGRIGVISDLHQAIYDTFNEHGIVIAFPQRDVRLFTQKPLDVRVERDGLQSGTLGTAGDDRP